MAYVKEEFRGVDSLVYAKVLNDDNKESGGYLTSEVKPLAPVAEISKTSEVSTESKYYDNKAMLTINAEGTDTITLTIPALDLKTLADLTGKTYDDTLGAFLDGEITPTDVAIGYRIKLTDGTYRYIWRYKCSITIPDENSTTENAGTDTNNQQLTCTGIYTIHKFINGGSQKALVVDERDDKAELATFFATVTTADTLKAKSVNTQPLKSPAK